VKDERKGRRKELLISLLLVVFLLCPTDANTYNGPSPQELLEEAYNKGVENSWAYAALLLERGRAEGGERGLELLEFSRRLGPDLPTTYLEASFLRWRLRPWELYTPFRGYIRGFKALFRNVPLLFMHAVQLSFFLGMGMTLAVILCSLLLLLRRLPIFLQTRLWLKVIILALPLLLRLNIVWCFLLWGIFLWPYLEREAKVFLFLCLVGLTYLLPLSSEVSHLLSAQPGHLPSDLYELNYGERKEELWKRLLQQKAEGPFDRDLLLSLAVAHKREGRYEEAKRELEAILRKRPTDADAWCNLGNLLLLEGSTGEAIKAYRKAISYRPSEGIYYYNLSKALMQHSIFFLPEAYTAFRRAAELAPQRIAMQLQREAPHPNRSILDAPLRRGRILGRELKALWQGGGRAFLWRAWFRPLSERVRFLSPVTILALLILLGLLKPEGEVRRCSMCGRIFSGLYSQREGRRAICLRCATIIRGREKDLPAREEKLREIRAFIRREEGILRGLVHLPGAGHFWKGHYLMGLCLSFLFFTVLNGLIHYRGVLPHPYFPFHSFPSSLPLWVLALLGVYWVGWRDSKRRSHREVFRPPFYLGI